MLSLFLAILEFRCISPLHANLKDEPAMFFLREPGLLVDTVDAAKIHGLNVDLLLIWVIAQTGASQER